MTSAQGIITRFKKFFRNQQGALPLVAAVLFLLAASTLLIASFSKTTEFGVFPEAAHRRPWWLPQNWPGPAWVTPTPSQSGAGLFSFQWNGLSYGEYFRRQYIFVSGTTCNTTGQNYTRFDVLAKTSGTYVLANGFDTIAPFNDGQCWNFNAKIQVTTQWCTDGSPLTIKRSYRIIGQGAGEWQLGSVTANPRRVCGPIPTGFPVTPTPTGPIMISIPPTGPISCEPLGSYCNFDEQCCSGSCQENRCAAFQSGPPTPTGTGGLITGTATVTLSQTADLVCMIQSPRSLTPGSNIPIIVKFRNQGSIGSVGGETHEVLVTEPMKAWGPIYPRTPSLLPGGSVDSRVLTITNAVAGQYTVKVNVDIYNRTWEGIIGEGNNTCESSFTVGSPLD